MLCVEVDNIKVPFPECWDELTKDQLYWLSEHFDLLVKMPYLFKVKAFVKLMDVRFYSVALQLKLSGLNEEQVLGLTKLVDFLNPIHTVDLSKNLFPKIRHNGKWLYGPSDLLQNISIEEFAFADKAFISFMRAEKNDKDLPLSKLVACLYRPKNQSILSDKPVNGDFREPFNSFELDYNTRSLRKLPLALKLSVLLFYWGCRNKLSKIYPNVFSGKNKNKASSLELGWISVIFELAGNKMGTIDDTASRNLHFIFIYLENELIKNQP
jgi:hypothetical protein